MSKKIFAALAVIVMIVGLIATLYAGDACKTYYSKCTEGGCKDMSLAESCMMICSGGTIQCSEVVAIE
ncbi:MAG: hypothetical protein GTO45_11675 [Candidatus Aminicenantes bacterium]|nr:hypothetical protein [Candidatus Aminicenantes bacterium]NIM79464.1 hypothetical protein [Candidatus Aminicenantes bacterium]NIN18750.1 hypothetical protein [Candidatus Aminicenantes bacterium]NIN42672.1 hypothetical protein [Candidatus Aminicenantes bacterium]NIN85406.1 hypothetical protein [Candidatus Aminicenantes bacterium]